MITGLTRYDTADPGFFERVQQAFVTAEQAERHLIGVGTESGAEAARLEMLRRHGLLPDEESATAAREKMIARKNRK